MAQNEAVNKMSAEDFINFMLSEAVNDQASDIHIEPLSSDVRIRFRIDGVLFEKYRKPLYEYEAIVNRIKVLGNIDFSHGIPQDGHFEFMVGPEGKQVLTAKMPADGGDGATPSISSRFANFLFSSKVENEETAVGITEGARAEKNGTAASANLLSARISIFPTISGEAIVLRMLNRQEMLLPLNNLGMDDNTLKQFKRLVSKDYGMILVTGPSGAGKTTTLYSLVQSLKSKDKNIVTLEDPVEIRFDDVRQSEVKAEHGLTFGLGTRAILRQDPDIIMIGEIRDQETAEHAVRASLTGRIVLSTIHSNTTLGTVPRLIDMNVERSLIAYALNGVVAQRLVRKVCQSCKVAYTPHQEFLTYFKIDAAGNQFVKGSGCNACRQTGYQGRTGLFEVLYFDDTIQIMIIEKTPLLEIEAYIRQSGMQSLKQDAINKSLAGLTTLEEAGKVV